MNKQRKNLLRTASSNGGRLKMQTAFKSYSDRSSAKSAVQSLVSQGFLSKTGVPGVFKLEKLPRDLKQELQQTEVSEA